MGKNHYYVSASSEKSAMQMLSDVKLDNWTFVPWGNSYVRENILYPLKVNGVNRDQLIGYYTEIEIYNLAGKHD